MWERSTQHPSQSAGQVRHTHLHRAGMRESLGLIISAIFLTWEGAEYEKKEVRFWNQVSFATNLWFCNQFSR